jgi:uncharacterized protein YcbX
VAASSANKDDMNAGRLTSIQIHPIKSCRRIVFDETHNIWEVEITATGLAHDREWQIVDAAGTPVTQRQHRVLAVVQPQLIDGGLRISAPGHDAVEVAHPTANDVTIRGLLGDDVNCGDAGDEAAGFFTRVTGEDCRLVAITPETDRRVGLFPNRIVTFVDSAPVLVVNTASLIDLQQRASEPIPMERFRPNLVIETEDPWAEDTWKHFTIGDARLVGTLPWPRCAIPQIDQDTSERTKEPAVVLRAHRWCAEAPGMAPGLRAALEGNALFGMASSIEPEGAFVKIGDHLDVQSTVEPLLTPPAAL